MWTDTTAGLRGLTGSDSSPTSQPVAVVGGYYAPNDGGGGLFYWDASSSTGDNDGTIIVPTGSSTGRWMRMFSDELNVRWFGAKGDSTTDDTAALQAALTAAAMAAATSAGQGGQVLLPNGIYKTTSELAVPAGVVLRGCGRKTPGASNATEIIVAHNGKAISIQNGPVTTTNYGNASIRDLTVTADPSSSPSMGAHLISVAYCSIADCVFTGFDNGVVLDGAEICQVERCGFEGCGVGIYLTNGATFMPGQVPTSTNVIAIRDCQFNGGQVGIVDDGGGVRDTRGCNFNANATWSIYMAGASATLIEACDFESAPIHFDYRSYSDAAVQVGGSTAVTFRACYSLRLDCVAAGALELFDNFFSTPAVAGGINVYSITARGNSGLVIDHWPTAGAIGAYGGLETARVMNGSAPATDPYITWRVGDLVWNTAPTAGGVLGWVCTTTGLGASAVWKGFGAVAP